MFTNFRKYSKPRFLMFLVMLLSYVFLLWAKDKEDKIMTIKMSSTSFKNADFIPAKYTCDGENISPPLAWEGVPANTKTLALIADDPDAPAKIWVHWVIFNIPTTVKQLAENIPTKKILDNGTKQGINDSRKIGYSGPCPPSGIHRYYFKIYALDIELKLNGGAAKEQVLKAMEGHILGQGQIMGKYERK